MKIPDNVRVGGVDYAVKFQDRIISEERHALIGQIHYDTSEILIEPNVQDEQGQQRTLLHKIFHAIERHYGMELDEDDIDRFACGWYMVLMDNPELMDRS